MLHRLRVHMRFPEGHWGPQWCYDQMAVRFTSAAFINPGKANRESALNYMSGSIYKCDIPLVNEIRAIDAFNTLSDPSILGVTVRLSDDNEHSWVERHICDHDAGNSKRSGCIITARSEGP
jgi:hypothetical protein